MMAQWRVRRAMRRPGLAPWAGCLLLLLLAASHSVRAAHEPEPILAPGDADPAGDADEDALPPTAVSLAPPPSPSPAPHVATILPLMPMVLPGCPNDDILNSNKPWVFPQKWSSLSAEAQALHPINLLFMNLAGVPSTDLVPLVTPCLYSWGIVKGSVVKIVKEYKVGNSMAMKTEVLVMRSKKNVFVVFRPTDDDWAANFDCSYTDDLRKKLNVPTPPLGAKKLQIHRGFWAAYSSVDKQVTAEVLKQLKQVKSSTPWGKPQVWLVGHSLGGALATILAFKLQHDPWFTGEIGGVVTYGAPRVGNEVWQKLYHDKLLTVTLRWHNHRDLFAALPASGQFCLGGPPLKTVFTFRHVGRAVLLCPSLTQPGLQEFRFFDEGTETSCNTGEVLIIGTHLLGHYFDGWRRAYAHLKGFEAASLLSSGQHVRSVMCAQCALAVKQYPLPDNKAARNDGVVSCVTDASCANKELFSVVSWAGMFPTSFFHADAVCDYGTALCQVPSPALDAAQHMLARMAPNITSAIGNMASKALANNPLASGLSQLLGITNSSSGGNSSSAGNGTAAANQLPAALANIFGNLSSTLPQAMSLWSEHLREGHMPADLAASSESSDDDAGSGAQDEAGDEEAPAAATARVATSSSSSSSSSAGSASLPASGGGSAMRLPAPAAGGSGNLTSSSSNGTTTAAADAAADAGRVAASLRAAVRPMAAALHNFSKRSQGWVAALSKAVATGQAAAIKAMGEQRSQ